MEDAGNLSRSEGENEGPQESSELGMKRRFNLPDRTYLGHFLGLFLLLLKSFTLISIILMAIINNSLVIISVILYRKLRHVNNYFLVSLAFADLFVAIFAMTFNANLEISGKIKPTTSCEINTEFIFGWRRKILFS